MTRPAESMRIVKNILLCGDCHTFLKFVSVIMRREIFLGMLQDFTASGMDSAPVKIIGVGDLCYIANSLASVNVLVHTDFKCFTHL
ncbi:hypothetical protein REPUB_Repub02eG0231300 [Reevesia pubescens]